MDRVSGCDNPLRQSAASAGERRPSKQLGQHRRLAPAGRNRLINAIGKIGGATGDEFKALGVVAERSWHVAR
jgi:hypothetical protein